MYDTTLSQKYAKDMGLCKKKNKRYIPKEGMPHASCWRSLERQFTYRKHTDRVAFPLEYSPKVYQSTEQVYYYA